MNLQNCCPPLVQVAKLGGLCSQVYAVLWESAYKDVRRDPGLHQQWAARRDCGGTTEWTVKGIANELGSCRKRVGKAIDQLLDNGFIIAERQIQVDQCDAVLGFGSQNASKVDRRAGRSDAAGCAGDGDDFTRSRAAVAGTKLLLADAC